VLRYVPVLPISYSQFFCILRSIPLKFILISLLISSLILSSCSSLNHHGSLFDLNRNVASIEDDLDSYLAVDRFYYYITEFTHAMDGKIPDQAMVAIKKITPKKIFAENIDLNLLNDAHNYDKLIYQYLKKEHSEIEVSKSQINWGYHFFKRKLNEAFVIKPSTLKGDLVNSDFSPALTRSQELYVTDINPKKLTLDSGHYISNRTTRAMFWEAADTGKTVEFHLGDSRTFMKHIQQSGAEVIAEFNPMAANYNKQFVVKYPGEDNYRYAITNIGGADRLEHMVHSLALSKLDGGNLSNKVVVHGDITEYHKRMTAKLTEQFEHLPRADRIIIGQKGAIDGQFNLFWKLQGLQSIYEKQPTKLKQKVGNEVFQDLEKLFNKTVENNFSILSHKKLIQDNYSKVSSIIEIDNNILPKAFKQFDYDTTEVQLSEFVFKNSQGKSVRWRVLGNVWGDEVVPLAQALKNTGHKNITYIGTTGAVPNKGHKIGDLVVPNYIQDGTSKLKVHGELMDIELAKVGGTVEHVGSPFEETFDWLNAVKSRSDFVEIETSYLRKIFNGADDNLRFYLLVSDILGSEGETLASASSSKRRKALNQILDALFARDKASVPQPFELPLDSSMSKLRSKVFKLYGSKGKTLQNYIISSLKGQEATEPDIKSFVKSIDNFSDDFFSKKVVQSSEVLSYIVRDIGADLPIPQLGISKDFIDGKFNPKKDKIKIQLYASSTEMMEEYKKRIDKFEDAISDISRWSEIEVIRGPPPPDMVATKATFDLDPDYLIKLYSRAAFLNSGMDYDVTYNGKLKYHFLPTNKTTNVCDTGRNFCSLAYYPPDQKTKDLLSKVTTIDSFDPKAELREAIGELNDTLLQYGRQEEFKAVAKIKKVNSLSDGKLAEIVPRFSATEGLVIELKITPKGLKSPLVVAEEIAHLQQITSENMFRHPLYWAEITLNAQYGSKRSKLLLAEAEIDAMNRLRSDIFYIVNDGSDLDRYIKARKSQGELLVKSIKTEVTKENKARKAITKQYKTMLENLQDQPKKLDDYIAANDRVGARKLIDAFMPWEEMEPTEISVWSRWLDALEHPTSNKSKKTLVFRGLADDLVRESDDGGHFLMSKLLTKNQGNYTRRLRSLKTYHAKLGQLATDEVPLNIDSYIAMMKGHSHDPVASPFLSTSTANVAENFASDGSNNKIGAIFIDQKRVMMNLVSDYNEFEKLVPLIVFPDELIAIEESTSGHDEINLDKLYATVKQKIGRAVKNDEKRKTSNQINRLANTKAWWEQVNPKGMGPNNVGPTCKGMINGILGL
jgi:hypothetical protein